MKRFRQFLTEKTSSRKLWLVFDLPNGRDNANIWQQVESRKLVGVKGISDNDNIMLDFFSVARNAAFVFDRNRLLAANPHNLVKINYHDPDSLLANNGRHLARIWNVHNGRWYWPNIMQRLADYSPKLGLRSFGNFFEDIGLTFTHEINNTRELAKAIEEAIPKVNGNRYYMEQKDFMPSIHNLGGWDIFFKKTFEKIANIYKNEGEIEVLNNTLIIPMGTTLLVEKRKFYEDQKDVGFTFNRELGEKYFAWKKRVMGLSHLYRIKWLEAEEWGQIRDIAQNQIRRRSK